MLRNDAKALLAEQHAAMAAVHESARNSGTVTEGSVPAAAPATPPGARVVSGAADVAAGVPFAVVTSVQRDSPASEAGLQEGDCICQAGSVRASAGAVQAIAAQLQVRLPPALIPRVPRLMQWRHIVPRAQQLLYECSFEPHVQRLQGLHSTAPAMHAAHQCKAGGSRACNT